MFLSNLIPNNTKNNRNNGMIEPTIIQCYRTSYVDFTKEEIVRNDMKNDETGTSKNNFPMLFYNEIPEYNTKLGVWNVNLSNNIDCIKLLLKDVILNEDKAKDDNDRDDDIVIITTIDLSSISSSVSSNENVQQIIQELDLLNITKDITTTIDIDMQQDLEEVTFGKAEGMDPINTNINVIISVIMPSDHDNSSSTSFREKQIQSLLYYHIVKYCYELNCTLAFITDSVDDQTSMILLSINQLRECLYNIISPPIDTINKNESSSLYTPNNYHPEIIFGTLQRNASWDDHWDASKDSLYHIIQSFQTLKKEEEKEELLEEEDGWLKRIESTVKVKKVESVFIKKKVLKETSNDDVNSFFNNLK